MCLSFDTAPVLFLIIIEVISKDVLTIAIPELIHKR